MELMGTPENFWELLGTTENSRRLKKLLGTLGGIDLQLQETLDNSNKLKKSLELDRTPRNSIELLGILGTAL